MAGSDLSEGDNSTGEGQKGIPMVGKIIGMVYNTLYLWAGRRARPPLGTSFLGGNGAGEKQPKFTSVHNNNTCLLGAPARRPAQMTLSCPPLHPR